MKKHLTKRLLSLVVVLALCLGMLAVPGFAAEPNGLTVEKVDNSAVSAQLNNRQEVDVETAQTPEHGAHDIVRVSIVVDGKSTLDLAQDKGLSLSAYVDTPALTSHRAKLLANQQALAARISEKALNGAELDVVWNLTLAANIISANVEYGQIEAIKAVRGVKSVAVEYPYEPAVVEKGEADPNMATSPVQTGSSAAWLSGYTGAGSRIAIIDTGTDLAHQSFNNDAFLYALADNARKAGMDYAEYVASLDLLDAEEIASVFGELNVAKFLSSADGIYLNEKQAFNVSYIDRDLDVSHYDSEHGSHVAGIATANRYIPDGNGGFVDALQSVCVQGVAPDAQLITMQVFGNKGGAYPADYMAAIEDAIVLKVDAVNLSLGSGNPGYARNEDFQSILDTLVESELVTVMSAGNSGKWTDATYYSAAYGLPYLFADDVSYHTGGSPGTYTNSLGVASVDNAGYTTLCVKVDGQSVVYAESTVGNDGTVYGNAPITTIGGTQEFVFLNGIGTDEQFQAIKDVVAGKVAMCYRGDTSFFEKANAAVAAGAIGVIIVNHTPNEIIYLNLTGYKYTAPVVSITKDGGELFKLGEPVTVGDVQYWTGTMEIGTAPEVGSYNDEYYSMSEFSSWGVPGDLSMKPEIAAPGGSIYSVFGSVSSTGLGGPNQYEVMSGTSMAAPQVTGMMALVMQYIRENNLSVDGLTDRALAQSLLMSTAKPMRDGESGYYYPVLQQGAGLANVGAAVLANSYILMGENATKSWADGKVKVELGDDPAKTGSYEFSFSINNLTDEEQGYTLSADFFTQDMFSYAGLQFLDTWTVPVAANVTWLVNGEALVPGEMPAELDFDGNGHVSAADGQAILDFLTGNRNYLYNSDAADLDADGDIDSYDAYLFFTGTSSDVTVPANGSVEITVQVQLDTAMLDQYPTGAYVQGYVYADCSGSSEGVAGVSHSIPVLGFYGNWTDPSMFDNYNYVYTVNNQGQASIYNSLLSVVYAGSNKEYVFGGNPMVPDPVTYPERAAISSLTGDKLYKMYFTSIRNAADAMFLAYDANTGRIFNDSHIGQVDAAYYNVNTGVWKQYNLGLNLGGWNGAGIPNDTRVALSLVLAPEYYAEADGTYDWSSLLGELGDGAFMTYYVTVDNTAPVIDEKSVVVDEDKGLLTFNASDNQYVSAAFLFDVYGQVLYTYTGSHAVANPGDELEYALDLSKVNGPSFLLQVYDYAGNASTYKITQQIGEVTDEIESVEISRSSLTLQKSNTAELSAIVYPAHAVSRDVVWSSSNESVATVDENGVVTAVAKGTANIIATSAADSTKTASCRVTVIDIDVDLNGIVWDEEGSIWFSEFNTTTIPAYTKLSGDMLDTDYLLTAAVGPNGTIYASTLNTSNGTGSLYTVDPVTYEATKLSDCMVQGLHIFYSDLTYAPGFFGTGALLGTYGPFVIAIDPTTGEAMGIIDEYNSDIVGIAACYGYYDGYGSMLGMAAGMDAVYVIEGNGTLTQEIYVSVPDLGAVAPFSALMEMGRMSESLPVNVGSAWYYNSAYYDYENAMLFWSAFDVENENAVTLYAIDEMNNFATYNLGQFGEGVWPVGGLYQAGVSTVNPYEFLSVEEKDALRARISEGFEAPQYVLEAKEWIVEEAPSAGGLNAVTESVVSAPVVTRPMNNTIVVGENALVLDVVAKNEMGAAIGSKNGLFTVTYDPASLTLDSIEANADYYSINHDPAAGTVTIAYVAMEGFGAADVVASLSFSVIGENVHPVVTFKQINNDAAYEYTETAHAYGEWTMVSNPQAGVPGREERVCAICGHVESRTVYMPEVVPMPGGSGSSGTTGGSYHVCGVEKFSDLSADQWYHEAVDFVVANGIMNGTGDGTTFSPMLYMTRGMMMTMLARMAGVDTTVGATWYEAGMKWAVANGISDGTAPTATMTREQLVTMLWRYAGSPITIGNYLDGYADADSISPWALDAMKWAVCNGIVQGNGNGLNPQGPATRIEVAQILCNFRTR